MCRSQYPNLWANLDIGYPVRHHPLGPYNYPSQYVYLELIIILSIMFEIQREDTLLWSYEHFHTLHTIVKKVYGGSSGVHLETYSGP